MHTPLWEFRYNVIAVVQTVQSFLIDVVCGVVDLDSCSQYFTQPIHLQLRLGQTTDTHTNTLYEAMQLNNTTYSGLTPFLKTQFKHNTWSLFCRKTILDY